MWFASARDRRILSLLIPAGFALGAGMELFMCNVSINGVNFYDVAKRKRAERIVDDEVKGISFYKSDDK